MDAHRLFFRGVVRRSSEIPRAMGYTLCNHDTCLPKDLI